MFGKFNPGARTEIIHLRATPEERAKISLAALQTRRTITNFVLSATLSAATKVLASTDDSEQVAAVVEPLPPTPNELDAHAAGLVNLISGLTSNLTQLTSHAHRIGGVLEGLAKEKGPLKNLSTAALGVGIAAKSGELKGAQAAILLNSLGEPAHQLNELAR